MRYRRYLFYVIVVFMIAFLILNGLNVSKHGTNDAGQSFVNHGRHLDKKKNSGTIATSNLRIIYNRVPKCGSRSALTLFKTLALQNSFKVIDPKKNYPYALEESDQKNISNMISSLKPPFLYHRHVHYMDFTRLNGPPVVYINLIRDPVSRAVSHFYFRRHGDGILGKSRLGNPIDSEKNKVATYDECILKGHRECDGNWGRFFIVPFFCGHTPKCRSPSRWALEKAKKCVVDDYLVVGVMEEFDDFLKVLEKLLPIFFKGAYETWKGSGTALHPKAVISKTRNKKRPSEHVIAIAKQRMALEYEFYDFVKKRFHVLKNELGI